MNLHGDEIFGTPPEPMTEPCARFFTEHARLFTFIYFVGDLIKHSHALSIPVAKLLTLFPSAEGNLPAAKGVLDRAICLTERYGRETQMYNELLLSHYVNIYLAYLCELLNLIFTTRPETMRSHEQITVEDVLQHATRESFVTALAERKVLQLAHKSLTKLNEYFSERLGVDLFSSAPDLERATVIVEVRNIIVHSFGRPNSLALSKVPKGTFVLGQRVHLSRNEVVASAAFLSRSVAALDTLASAKFRLPQAVASKDAIIERVLAVTHKPEPGTAPEAEQNASPNGGSAGAPPASVS